jgi:SAM-dependent methyltransferase
MQHHWLPTTQPPADRKTSIRRRPSINLHLATAKNDLCSVIDDLQLTHRFAPFHAGNLFPIYRRRIADARIANYESWYTTRRGQRADSAERAILKVLLEGFGGVSTLLEVGSGTGHFARWLAESRFNVVGFDRAPAMVREAQQFSFITFGAGRCRTASFPD